MASARRYTTPPPRARQPQTESWKGVVGASYPKSALLPQRVGVAAVAFTVAKPLLLLVVQRVFIEGQHKQWQSSTQTI